MTQQKLTIELEGRGDTSVGISDFYEVVTVAFEYGGHDSETLDVFQDGLKRLISECFGTDGCEARTVQN